ncbi:hypothetical protein [Actinoplanes teichomyceticus]|uniref:Uncharacterized protein n=1 Tax=Actinoplanes teichomyceticus TaxID=1867 RepID=A0A561VSG7_ACTTI|nr:hypothetical protein [Actinoplanes teichomyceticus]TWG14567.1 hypothetical protein FHX34_104872 [Actinoplanes teichomyceticus]
MTTVEVSAPPRRRRPLIALTWASLALAGITAIGLATDPRVLTGAPIWLKPFKFAVSFALYAWTLDWLLSVLPRPGRLAGRAATTVVGASVIELAIIVVQAARGTTSHYNQTTPLDAALWSAMGMSVMVLSVAHLLIAVTALRRRIPDRAAAYAIRLGLLICLLGMLAAVPMTMRRTGVAGIVGAHSVGVPDGGPGMPLTGWSTTGGDLRIGHFVGLHALQVLPVLAYALARWAGHRVDRATQARLVLVAGLAYGVLVPLLTWQALRAQPLLRPDAATLLAFAALAAATAAGIATVLSRRPQALR